MQKRLVVFTNNSQLILLRRLFLLAARHSANKFALCSRSAASVLNSQFSIYLNKPSAEWPEGHPTKSLERVLLCGVECSTCNFFWSTRTNHLGVKSDRRVGKCTIYLVIGN